jgi:hypothetical protein
MGNTGTSLHISPCTIASKHIAQTRSSNVLVPFAEYGKYPSFTAVAFRFRSEKYACGAISTIISVAR